MKALYRQLEYELQRFDAKPHSIDTLFIGGGTPSTVSPVLYREIFDLLHPYLKKSAEITTEANPNSASREWLEGMQKLGINRVSFGVQSFNAQKLKNLNRAHNPQDAHNAIESAYQLGIKHISLDIIYNYQGDTKELLMDDISQAFTLPIDHISAYELTIEANTPFAKTPQARQENEELAYFVADSIKERGFEHYEISNFGSYQSRHNQGYWRLENYIGAGAGAVGFLENSRYYPQTNIEFYISNPLDISQELLTAEELLTEKIFLGFRSTIGVDSQILSADMKQSADLLVSREVLHIEGDRYQNLNFFLADEVALHLLRSSNRDHSN